MKLIKLFIAIIGLLSIGGFVILRVPPVRKAAEKLITGAVEKALFEEKQVKKAVKSYRRK